MQNFNKPLYKMLVALINILSYDKTTVFHFRRPENRLNTVKGEI